MKGGLVFVFALIGLVAGVAVVRMYFLNSIQIIGWNLFWDHLSHLNLDGFKLVLKSATFGKCLLGGAVGAVVGAVVGSLFRKK